ncbi:DUF4402 domain-containing protein [Novosphingobium sp. TH158]|uniref:DUF4402 domain-containing protein n=1 Tax=Novosphingobium sp. TH158 TaxID=2067455 RepID=UPI000C7CA547|nr:DUF4402 domain-containing protein [Novosphingobium sp. TH158]PLK27094.1 hypothetical protein C0V78_09515 [Novosphingobium sp. TH158]
MKKIIALALVAAGFAAAPASAQSAADTSTATANGSVTIIRPLTVTKNTDLVFGRVVQPRSGTGTVSIANNSNTTVAGAGAVALSGITTSHATFTVDGEGGQVVTVAIPSTFDLANGSNTITVTLSPDVGATETLSNALGAAGSKAINVGGSFSLPASQASGEYTGTFDVTVAYQ